MSLSNLLSMDYSEHHLKIKMESVYFLAIANKFNNHLRIRVKLAMNMFSPVQQSVHKKWHNWIKKYHTAKASSPT
jgi:hypothetical protein